MSSLQRIIENGFIYRKQVIMRIVMFIAVVLRNFSRPGRFLAVHS